MLRLFSKHNPDEDRILALYRSIMAQARHEAFYLKHGVPDTVDGRFELLIWHAIFVIRRVKGDGGKALAQRLFDVLFADMDQALRELGFGDSAVPRRIKVMAQAFYGRAAAIDDGLARTSDAAGAGTDAVAEQLEELIARNLFPDGDALGATAGLARYFAVVVEALQSASREEILSGAFAWPDPAPHASERAGEKHAPNSEAGDADTGRPDGGDRT